MRVFPYLKREFSHVYAEHLPFFQSILGANHVLTSDLAPYNTDFLHIIQGSGSLVLRPRTTLEISQILAYCDEHRLPIIPQGGNTGLAGGNIAQHGEIVLSMSRLNPELRIDPNIPAVYISSGSILETVSSACKAQGFAYPLDLAAKGTCQIGGNLSTNAGGIRYLRYGSLHSNILGLEVVLASGEVLNDLNSMRKNNTGYDLKQVFIGSEGTLGVITRAAVLLYPYPTSVQVAFFGCSSFEKVLETYGKARAKLNEILSAFEFLDKKSISLVLKHVPNTRNPFSSMYPYYVLLETAGSNSGHDLEKLSNFLESVSETGNIEGVLGKDDGDRAGLWKLRETCANAYAKEGRLHVFDFSLPIEHFENAVFLAEKWASGQAEVVGVGHLGDGNLHIGLIERDLGTFETVKTRLEGVLCDFIQDKKGSISAEHGIGTTKKEELLRTKSKESMETMVFFS